MPTHSYRLLKQIYLPFLAFIVIPMILLNCAIIQLLRAIQQEEYQENLAQLEVAGNYINNVLEESISLSRNLLFDSDIQQLAYIPEEKQTADYAKIRTIDDTFQKYYRSACSDNFSLHVYYTENSIFLSTDGSCHDLSYFYGKSYQLGDYSLEQIDAIALASDYNVQFHTRESFLANGISYEGLFYTTALNHPVNEQQKKGLIFSIIHQEFLDNILKSMNGDNGFSYITDRSGRILSLSGEATCEFQPFFPSDTIGYVPEEIYGKGYIASYICLPEGINLYSIRLTSEIVRETHMLTLIVFALNLTTLVLCAVIVVSITRKRYRKLSEIFSMLNLPSSKHSTDYHDSLTQGITALVNKNQNLSTSLSQNLFLLRSEFWNKLLHYNYSSEQEMQELAAASDLNLQTDYFCLIILSLRQAPFPSDPPENAGLEKESLRTYHKLFLDHVEAKTMPYGYIHSLSVQQTLVFLRISEEDKNNFRQFAESLLCDLPTPPQDITICRVGSRLFDSIFLAGKEYSYCSNVLLHYYEAFCTDQTTFAWSADEYNQSDTLYFPKKLSEQMVNTICAGDQEKVTDCFREIFSHNFSSEHSVTPAMSTLLILRLKMVLMEAYRDEMGFNLHDRFLEIDRLPYDAVMVSHFIQLANEMCSYYQQNIAQKTEKLRQKIASYIKENFTSVNFSLTEVAAHCGFSDSYFSILFREIMQVNFSAYVERLKMEYADQLLLETSLKVDEIALKVGYSDGNAFRRAYKKYYAVSPSKRREK